MRGMSRVYRTLEDLEWLSTEQSAALLHEVFPRYPELKFLRDLKNRGFAYLHRGTGEYPFIGCRAFDEKTYAKIMKAIKESK